MICTPSKMKMARLRAAALRAAGWGAAFCAVCWGAAACAVPSSGVGMSAAGVQRAGVRSASVASVCLMIFIIFSTPLGRVFAHEERVGSGRQALHVRAVGAHDVDGVFGEAVGGEGHARAVGREARVEAVMLRQPPDAGAV